MLFPQKTNSTAEVTQMSWDATTNMTQMDGGEFVCYNESFLLCPDESLM